MLCLGPLEAAASAMVHKDNVLPFFNVELPREGPHPQRWPHTPRVGRIGSRRGARVPAPGRGHPARRYLFQMTCVGVSGLLTRWRTSHRTLCSSPGTPPLCGPRSPRVRLLRCHRDGSPVPARRRGHPPHRPPGHAAVPRGTLPAQGGEQEGRLRPLRPLSRSERWS